MHEGALTENLFEHVLTHAKQAHARRVTHISVTIGALSDSSAESIRFYFNQLSPETIVAGATLEFEVAPGTARCPTCHREFEIEEEISTCPVCGTFPVQITGGNGVYLSSLEVETEDEEQESIHE